MSDLEKDQMEDMEEELVVVMTDEEGNEFYYREEMIIPVGEKRYAILVPIEMDEDCDCEAGCDCGCSDDEVDVFIARIDEEDGEEVYVDPTDEEFEEVRKAYEELMSAELEAE